MGHSRQWRNLYDLSLRAWSLWCTWVRPCFHRAASTLPLLALVCLDPVLNTTINTDEQGLPLVYDRASREREREMHALCRIVGGLVNVVPNGIVCFFASYEFLKKFKSVLEGSSEMVHVLRRKAVFFESQGLSLREVLIVMQTEIRTCLQSMPRRPWTRERSSLLSTVDHRARASTFAMG